MRPARAGVGGEGLRPVSLGDLSAASRALRLIRAWGFRYKTVAFVWLKRNRKSPSWFYGMGYWTRANVELCLLATKGSPKRHSANVHQVVFAPIAEHSKKPDIIREKIVELAGDLPRIELFARQSPTGWDVWGNEVDCTITLRRERRKFEFGTGAKRMLMERLDDCLKVHADLLDSQDIGSIYELQDLAQLHYYLKVEHPLPRRGGSSAVVSGPVGSCPLVQRGKHPCPQLSNLRIAE